ncbi:MAG: HD domain-containing protein [Patescibacteria group bacterium]
MTITEFFASLHGISLRYWGEIGLAVHVVCVHQGRQIRKSGEPYLEHVFGVMAQMIAMKLPKVTVIAACLHDIVEDTDATVEMIRDNFGEKVARIVWGVSKGPHEDFDSEQERLDEFYERFMRCIQEDWEAVFPKLGDRLHNLLTLEGLRNSDPELFQRMPMETIKFYVPLAFKYAPPLVPPQYRSHLIRYGHQLSHLALSYLPLGPK